MNEKLLKKMIAVVDGKMTANKSDFYSYDLAILGEVQNKIKDKELEFFWEVNPYHTHLLILNEGRFRNILDEDQTSRFQFGRDPDDFIAGNILYFAKDNQSTIYHYDGSVQTDDFIHEWKGGEFIADIILRYIQPMRDSLISYVDDHYHDEAKWYNKPLTIKYATQEVAEEVQSILCSDEGENLSKRLKQLQQWMRISDNHVIVISRDFMEKSFFFSEQVNNEPRICGGIIYDGKEHSWSIHT